MACKELKTVIGGKDLYARQWGATKALNMQIKLLNVCGSHAIPFIEGKYTFDHALQLMAATRADELLPIMKEFIFCARVSTEQGPTELNDANFDMVFNGQLIDTVLIFGAICTLQYQDFFEQGRALLPNKSK